MFLSKNNIKKKIKPQNFTFYQVKLTNFRYGALKTKLISRLDFDKIKNKLYSLINI